MNIFKVFAPLLLIPVALAVAGEPVESPAPVITTLLQEQLAVWPEGEAIVTRLELPANFPLSEHYHPGEEVLYVIEGEAWIHFPDKPDIQLFSGESARIPAKQVHSGSAGADGLKAVVFRVHVKGQPVRIDVTSSP